MLGIQQTFHDQVRESLLSEIKKVFKVNKSIKDIVISYFDGTPIVSSTNGEIEYILSAVASAFRGIADKVSNTLKVGTFIKLIVHYRDEEIVVFSVDNQFNILIRAFQDAPLGILIRDATNLINKIKDYL